LGDNRDRSRDSRFWGAVSRERIRGRALAVYFSLRSGEVDSDRAPDPSFCQRIRWRRTGRLVR
ncbi:MAG: S26 family signal peptidase, partial [Thermoanaerobaculia bacterium]|nr:S26 family signal peptidase [Thermoanaerobaculia bacterium]